MDSRMVNATIIGARGYLGRELLRLLLEHPETERVVPVSSSQAGQSVAKHVPALRHRRDLTFRDADDSEALDVDVVFMATPGGLAGPLTEKYEDAGVRATIDLSRDHRLQGLAGKEGWTYGLADVWPVAKGTPRIANPGCYPTASLLALAPALKAGLVQPGPVIVDGKSGVSGAGVNPASGFHYPEMNESVRAYKVLGHDHTAEIQACSERLGSGKHPIRFTPHLVPQTRGLLATVYAPVDPDVSGQAVRKAYQEAYAESMFVGFVDEASTGHVRGSNYAEVAVDIDPETNLLVARGAIDNLVKGGSGTAIQNMNDTFGLPSHLGLTLAGGNP